MTVWLAVFVFLDLRNRVSVKWNGGEYIHTVYQSTVTVALLEVVSPVVHEVDRCLRMHSMYFKMFSLGSRFLVFLFEIKTCDCCGKFRIHIHRSLGVGTAHVMQALLEALHAIAGH